MKLIRNKIIIFITISALVLLGIIIFIHFYFGSSVEKIKRSYAETQVQLLQNHIKVNSSGATSALTRLSEQTGFQPCTLSASGLPEGIGDQLAMAGFSFLIVTDTLLFPTVSYPEKDQDILKFLPDNRQIFRKTLSDGRITRYYHWENDSLYEVSLISVPGCSRLKADSIGEWIFAGRYISQELTDRLILQLPGKVSIQRPPKAIESVIDTRNNTYSTNIPLYGWDNLPVASLRIETHPKLMKVIAWHQLSLLLVLIIMAVAFMIFIYMYLSRYYILPLKLISLALRQKDPEYLRMISDTDPDFNSLQNMLINVFNQEKLLADIMKRRSTDQMNTYHAAILSKINEAVYTYDFKGIITYWNNAAEDLYKISEPEAISKIAHELIKNRWGNKEDEKNHVESLKTTGVWQGILLQELPDGTEINVEASISCLYDSNQNLLGYLSIVRKPYR